MSANDIHPIQAKILCELLFRQGASFSELNKKEYGSDQFSFHLKQLTNLKLITKNQSGKYVLTTSGKEFANRFDTAKNEVEKQAKVAVLIVCTKLVKGKKFYLVQQRLKQPYYGYWGFFGGKIRWGETIEEAAKRELLEETGLSGNMVVVGARHKMDYDEAGKLLEDKFFWIMLADKIKGRLVEQFEGGINKWMPWEEISTQNNLFDGLLENLDLIEMSGFQLREKKYVVKGF